MNVRTARWLLIMIFMLVAVVGCSLARHATFAHVTAHAR